ncbi:Retrovirus Polyprotein, partial [Phytophthora megakarya]
MGPTSTGRLFTIVTDHAALRWLMTSPNLTGKLHRWALALQEFEFDVKYRPGSSNSGACGGFGQGSSRTTATIKGENSDAIGRDGSGERGLHSDGNGGGLDKQERRSNRNGECDGRDTHATCTMQSDVGRILKENETTVRAVLSDMVKAVEEGTVPNDEQLQKPTVRDTRRPRTQRRTAGTALPAGERPMTRAAKRRAEEQRRREAVAEAVATDVTTQPKSGASNTEMAEQQGGSQRTT